MEGKKMAQAQHHVEIVEELDRLTELARGPEKISGNVGVTITLDRRLITLHPRSITVWIGVARGVNHTVTASTVHDALGKSRRWIEDFWKAEGSA
jgi:hypothetical protein